VPIAVGKTALERDAVAFGQLVVIVRDPDVHATFEDDDALLVGVVRVRLAPRAGAGLYDAHDDLESARVGGSEHVLLPFASWVSRLPAIAVPRDAAQAFRAIERRGDRGASRAPAAAA